MWRAAAQQPLRTLFMWFPQLTQKTNTLGGSPQQVQMAATHVVHQQKGAATSSSAKGLRCAHNLTDTELMYKCYSCLQVCYWRQQNAVCQALQHRIHGEEEGDQDVH